jgi:hypothetical protein
LGIFTPAATESPSASVGLRVRFGELLFQGGI